MSISGFFKSRRGLRSNALIFVGVAATVSVIGITAARFWDRIDVPAIGDDQNVTDATQIETIFMPIDREIIPIPSEAIGSGGGMTSWSGVPVVVTATGEFIAVENGEATKLAIAAPENGVDAYAAYVKETSDRDPREYWFRYNDVLYSRERGELILSYSLWNDTNACATNAIAVAPAEDRPGPITGDWVVKYETAPCLPISEFGSPIHGQMAGGRLVQRDDGKILLASGDYGKDGLHAPPMAAQASDYDYGKIIEIDLDTGAARHISSGHSNPQGIALDRDGEIWIAEHGRRGGDELNHIQDGKNYGWPLTSLGTRYNKLAIPTVMENGQHSGAFEAPVYAWLPSVAPGALMLIDGFDPLWDGDLLLGTFKDQALYRIRVRNDRVLFAERIPVGQRVRHLQMLEDGRIAIFTDAKTVELLSVGAADHAFEYALTFADQLDVDTATRASFLETLDACSQCHSLGQVSNSAVPALGSVFGRAFSAEISARYEGPLSAANQVWNEETLTAFLDNPNEFAPGTSMPDPMLEEGEVLSKLVLLLYALARIPQ